MVEATVDSVQPVGLDGKEDEVVLGSQIKLCGISEAIVVTWPWELSETTTEAGPLVESCRRRFECRETE